MKMTKLGYFFEFLLFPPLIIAATLYAFDRAPPHPLPWLSVYVAGLFGWTLFEYWLHRVLFHHVPVFSAIHERHHDEPLALIGTPAWASAIVGTIAFAAPFCAILGADLGSAATAGLVTGYLWYVFVHYAIHQWQPRRGSYLYRARLRHARHHHQSQDGNFGVTTALWDRVFGTALETLTPRPRAAKS
jgi:sterol desaturase/sphingolipid hydroxylase (fatty acid hydroxylase superfamily)